MSARDSVRRLRRAPRKLFRKLWDMFTSCDPTTDSTRSSNSSASSMHPPVRPFLYLSFNRSLEEGSQMDTFFGMTRVGSPSSRPLGHLNQLEVVNPDPRSPPFSPCDYVSMSGEGQFGSRVTQNSLQLGSHAMVNPDPMASISSSSTSSSLSGPLQSSASSETPASSLSPVVLPDADIIIRAPSSPQERMSHKIRCVSNPVSEFESLPYGFSPINSHNLRPTHSERPTSNSLNIQILRPILPPYPLSEAQLRTHSIVPFSRGHWKKGRASRARVQASHVLGSIGRPPYPTSELENVIDNSSRISYPRPLLASPRTSTSVKRQTSEMFLGDPSSLSSQQVPQLTDNFNFGRNEVEITRTSVSSGRFGRMVDLVEVIEQEERSWAHGSLSESNTVSLTLPNTWLNWPWRGAPGDNSSPIPADLVAGLAVGQVARDRKQSLSLLD